MPVPILDSLPPLASLIRAGDAIIVGQAGAEPLTLSRALVEEAQLDKEEFPEWSRYFDAQLRKDLKQVDKTVRFLKSEMVHEDDIEACLEYQDHYSDRKLSAKNQYREKPRHKQFFRKQQRPPPMRR